MLVTQVIVEILKFLSPLVSEFDAPIVRKDESALIVQFSF